MRKDHVEHDLFLLMINLSQVRDADRVRDVFIDAVNAMEMGALLSFEGEATLGETAGDAAGDAAGDGAGDAPGDALGDAPAPVVIPVSTMRNTYGRISLRPDPDDPPSPGNMALIRNAIRMLALILENRWQDRLLAREKEHLEEQVRLRTAELTETNARLREQIHRREREEMENQRLQAQLLQARKMEAIGTLAGGVAHDFNNLLFIILGNISMARERLPESDPTVQLLKNGESACLRSRELTQRLVRFAENEEPSWRPEPVGRLLESAARQALSGDSTGDAVGASTGDAVGASTGNAVGDSTGNAVGDSTGNAVGDSTGNAVGDSIRLEMRIPPAIWPVAGDAINLRQAIAHLVANAEEAMPGGGRLRVRARNLTVRKKPATLPLAPGRYVKIEIRDEGHGIQKEHLSRIFDPYFSTRERGTRKGMGMGLATAYATIRRHRGHILVKSKPGRGATVHLWLAAADGGQASDLPSEARHADICRGRILVMDDEEMVRRLSEQMLNRLGYATALARNGEEAIRLYRRHMEGGDPIAAAILDLTVRDGMGGREAAERLLALDPAFKAIISSGYVNDPVIRDYHRHGFLAALSKPYQMRELDEVLGRIL